MKKKNNKPDFSTGFDSLLKNGLWKFLSNSVLHVDKEHRAISLKSHPTAQQSQDFNPELCRFKALGDLSTGAAGTVSPFKKGP